MLFSAIRFSKMIKLGHTLFALPFALSAILLAYRQGNSLSFETCFYIILAFIGARAFAMGFNRIADRKFDAQNPRTKNRELASGNISLFASIFYTAFFGLLLVFSAYMLNPLCFYLSVPALAFLAFYSYTKRFSALSHYVLGVAIAMAPIGAWIAITSSINLGIIVFSMALLFHISGFDLLYSLQDEKFDKENNLFSIPSKFGGRFAKRLSLMTFALALICLFLTGFLFDLNFIYFLGILIIGFIYFSEHIVIKFSALRHIKLVFFNMNVCISLLIFIAITLSVFIEC